MINTLGILIGTASSRSGGSSGDPEINTITLNYSSVQRTDTNISITATTSADITSWYWELRNATTKTVIETKTTQSPSFTAVATPGLYDVVLIATSSTDTYYKYIEDAFYNHLPKPTEAECDIVVDFSSSTTYSYFQNFSGVDNAGLIIGIKGSHVDGDPASGGYFYPDNLRSSDPNNPVRIVKLGTTETVIQNKSGSGSLHTWLMDNGAENIVVDGYLPNGTPGIKIQAIDVGSQNVMIRGKYSGIHWTGTILNQDIDAYDNAGSNLTFSPIYTTGVNATNWLATSMVVFGNHISASNQEGMYINFNNDGSIGGFIPFKIDGLVVARNIVENSGRDGIQIGAATSLRLHDNIILNWGLWQHASHESAVSYNGGNAGRIFNNYASGGKMLLNIQSGLYPWNIFAGETSPRPSYFYSNVLVNGSYSAGGATEPDAIYIQNQPSSGSGELHYYLFNNTIITDKAYAEGYGHTSSFTYTIHSWNNLIISDNGTMTTAGSGTHPTIEQNDLIDAEADIGDQFFTDANNGDYTISSFTAPAYAGTPTDLILKLPELKYNLFDRAGFPLLALGENFTFGAYSGFEKRTVDPGSVGTPTYTTPLSSSGISTNKFTIDCQPDQNGWLYVVVTPGDDPDPSTDQILAGTDASDGTPTDFFIMTNGQDGVMASVDVTGLTSETAYDVHAVFVNVFGQVHTITKLNDVTTEADEELFAFSDFWISSLNRTRLYFTTSSEAAAASDFTGFTLSSGKTISSMTVVSATKGYFTVNSAYTTGDTESITYSGGSDIENINGVLLSTFGLTTVENRIGSTDWTAIEWVDGSNVTISGNDITGTARGAYARSLQMIPSGSNGDIIFYQDEITRDNGIGAACSLIDKDDDGNGLTDLLHYFVLQHTNTNVAVLQGSTTITTLNALQTAGLWYRININRATNKTRLYTATATYPSIPNDSDWTLRSTHSGTVTTDAVRAAYHCWVNGVSQIGKGLVHTYIRCVDGLATDTE